MQYMTTDTDRIMEVYPPLGVEVVMGGPEV